MGIKCFTIITHKEGYYNILVESCIKNNLHLDVIGLGDVYTSHLYKTYKTIEYLNKQDPNDIIIFVDGFDSIILEDAEIIKEKFIKLNVPCLISEDMNYSYSKYLFIKFFYHFNLTNTFLFNDIMKNSNPCLKDNKLKFINSGLFIGYSKYLLELFVTSLKYINKINQNSNQRLIQDMCNLNVNINIDTNNVIFRNFSNKDKILLKNNQVIINGISSSIISKPCMSKMNNICKYLGYDISSVLPRSYIRYYIKNPNKNISKMILFVVFVILLYFIIERSLFCKECIIRYYY